MRPLGGVAIIIVLILGMTAGGVSADTADGYWPTWRGPNADGVAVQGNPPTTWSETENIKWKVAIPGKGISTPVVWGNKMFLQTAIPEKEDTEAKRPERGTTDREIFTAIPTVSYKFNVVCLDRRTGETLWERTAREAIPHEGFHSSGSLANYSPVTDGKLVWASFGSRGMHCYDVDGNHKWSADLVEMLTFRAFGEGSSPALAGDAVIVVTDHEGDSKIFAFNKDTGELLWEKDRDEGTSWATPLPVKVNGSYQVVTSATNFIRSYDAKTGDIVWQCSGLFRGAIASPVIGFDKVYCATGYNGYKMLAIELDRKGDLSESDAIAWQIDEGTPYVSTPLLYGDMIYFVQNLRPVLSCYEADTGKPLFTEQKLEGMRTIYSSPVGAGGHIYLADRKGKTIVLKHSDTFEVVAMNSLNDIFDSSPIVVGDEMYLRGNKYLYCISEG